MMKRWSAAVLARTSLAVLSRLDAERAHDLGLAGLRLTRPFWSAPPVDARLAVRCFGVEFAHPLGLAAGFDKNGECLDAWGALGFGHVEVGTVTPRPQAGNPKPRLFRAPQAHALVNRMGFNNLGVDHLISRLTPSRYPGVRGISIGKNAGTSIEEAETDYVTCLRTAYCHADYIAVNVSSPNTARLRELQARDGLERIVGALLEERARLVQRHGGRHVPLLVKIAPNLDPGQLEVIAATLAASGIDGVIATNTSTDLTPLGSAWPQDQRGGLSGAPLHALSINVIQHLRARLGPSFPIIGVGGITSADDALATLRAGANLIQVYTGFATRGQTLVTEILEALTRQLTTS